MNIQNIAIIGGGPAGFMVAVVAAENSSGKIHIDIFEGPLDLLLYLIKKDEVDIYDIEQLYATAYFNNKKSKMMDKRNG